jgi:hypothetical protein
MIQSVERAIHVDYEQLYILLERRRMDQAPIEILAKMTHGRISATGGVEARPPSKLQVRNNNVCLLSRKNYRDRYSQLGFVTVRQLGLYQALAPKPAKGHPPQHAWSPPVYPAVLRAPDEGRLPAKPHQSRVRSAAICRGAAATAARDGRGCAGGMTDVYAWPVPRKANPARAQLGVSPHRGHNCRTCFLRGRLGALHGR